MVPSASPSSKPPSPSIQEAIEDGVITAEQLVRMYLKRIEAYDGKHTATHLNSYIAVNDDDDREAQMTVRAGKDAGTDVTNALCPAFR